MEENLTYSSEEKKKRILSVFLDQKIKYQIEELPTSKIQGLTAINPYQLKEVLNELNKQGIIKISKSQGRRVYWRLV